MSVGRDPRTQVNPGARMRIRRLEGGESPFKWHDRKESVKGQGVRAQGSGGQGVVCEGVARQRLKHREAGCGMRQGIPFRSGEAYGPRPRV